MIADRYYYNCLDKREQNIYRILYAGILEHKETIPIPSCNLKEESFQRIFSAMANDNPLLYYLNQSAMSVASDQFGNTALCPQYFFKKETVEEYNRRIQQAANTIIADLKLTEGTDYEKEQKVHDYFCKNIAYDHLGSDTGNITRVIMSHNILGVFAKKRAMCEGIAKAVKVLLNAVDVKCIVVSGTAYAEDGSQYPHAWNMVKIDGEPYHLDVTYDIGSTSNGNIAYDWFNVNDAIIQGNHISETKVPVCSADGMNYYTKNKVVFSTKQMAVNYVKKNVSQGKRILYMRFKGKLKVQNVYETLANTALQEAAENGISLTATSSPCKMTNTLRIWLH